MPNVNPGPSSSQSVQSTLITDVQPVKLITYDGSSRVATYTVGGVLYTCTYYTTGNGNGKLATIIGGGTTWTYSYNSSGLLTDEVVS